MESIALWELLRQYSHVTLWSQSEVHSCYSALPIRKMDCENIPLGGTLVILDFQNEPGNWLESGRFSRIVFKLNTAYFAPPFKLNRRVLMGGLPAPEFVFDSPMLKRMSGLDGLVELSTISLTEFSPVETLEQRPFTVGRHSRDVEFKHHEDDPSLYRMLALQGHRVRVMGGVCLEPHIGVDRAGIELLAAGAVPASEFLQSIDCFFYRCHPSWLEGYGRVVFEAMACGLPVVCERRGGYADFIEHGINGFLVSSQEDAWDILQELSSDKPLRQKIGNAARLLTESLYSSAREEDYRAWYLASKASEQSE